MIEFILLITFLGLIFSSHPRYGVANPFQIYFLVWFATFFGYYLTETTWIPVSDMFLFVHLALNLIWLISFVIAGRYIYHAREVSNPSIIIGRYNKRIFNMLQIVAVLGLPFTYLAALDLSLGMDIFTVEGFVRLRKALTTEELGYGFFSYLSVLSLVISSIAVVIFKDGNMSYTQLIISVAASLGYCYLATGRTAFMLFFTVHLFPCIVTRRFKMASLASGIILMSFAFGFIAMMTHKGMSAEDDLTRNVLRLIDHSRGYTVGPLIAFSALFESPPEMAMGDYTFRTLYSAFYALKLSSVPPVSMFREFTLVPDLTNVYTVYDPYYRDFGNLGFLFVFIFIILHVAFYQRSYSKGGIYVFLYSATLYPLIMQFFQDQYFSLISMWAQCFFWYWVVLEGIKLDVVGIANKDARYHHR